MNPMCGADGAAIAIAGYDEDVQVWAAAAHAAGNRQRAAVQSMEAVGSHVMRKAAGAADAGDDHGLLGRQLLVTRKPLDGAEHRVISAAGAPTRGRANVVLKDAGA